MSEVNFIGSKISLISKAAIRYEGLLYAIDTNNATFTLSDVQSFGTEERPCEREIPPRAEVYKYIVFRSSDISDIHVIDPPRPEESMILSEDPAIVTISQTNPLNSNEPYKATSVKELQKQSPVSHGARSAFPNSAVGNSRNVSQMSHSSAHAAPPTSQYASYYGESKGRKRDEWNTTNVAQAENRKSNYNHSSNDRRSDAYSGKDYHVSQRSGYGTRSGYNYGGYDDSHVNYRTSYPNDFYYDAAYYGYGAQSRYYGNYANSEAYYTDAYKDPNRYYSGNNYYSGRYSFRGGERGGWGRNSAHGDSTKVRSTSKTRFNVDYDFEKANAKLEDDMAKLSVNGQAVKPQRTDADPAEQPVDNNVDNATDNEQTDESKRYDKQKSFFDTISSEAMDRLQGIHTGSQLNRREERRVNAETFGNRGGHNRFQGTNYYGYGNSGNQSNLGYYRGGSGRVAGQAGQWTRRRADTTY